MHKKKVGFGWRKVPGWILYGQNQINLKRNPAILSAVMNPHEILQPNVNLSHRFKSALLYTFGVSCDVVFCGVPKPIYCNNRPVGCNHRSVSSFSDALSNSRALIRKKNGRVSLRKTAKKEKLLYSWPVFLLSLFVLSFFILPAGRYHANGKLTAHLLIFRVRWIAEA